MTPPSPLAAPPSPALVVPLPANTIRTVSDTPATPDTAAEPVAADDLRSIYAIITDLLRQRRDEGRDRIRATNLKDSLMQRMPGFSERRYGFAKFKDLLMTAQKSGLLDVIIAGPVHWISLPGVAEPSKPTPVEATSAIVVDADTTAVAPAPPGERRAEMIRFVNELRTRSRWLTYTYVLTNLISHFGRSLPQSEAENEARATLNYLVQDGVLRVDREPQEVEVGGARHRVRMCHLDMSNELVIEALGVSRSETASSPPQDGSEDSRTELGPGSEDETLADLPLEQDEEPPVMASATDTSREERARDEASDGDVGPTHPAPGHTSAEESMSLVDIDRASRAAEEGLLSSPQQAVGSRGPAPEEATGDAPTEGEAPSPLHRAYSALQQVIGEAAAGGKKVMSASSVRGRLSITLGGFNERQLGFPRFKDFLEAAENARIVHTVTRGHVTWVSPVEGGEQGDTAEGR